MSGHCRRRAGRDDFPKLVERMARSTTDESSSWMVRNLFALRWKLGEIFGWDDEDSDVGAGAPSLRERLPADLRQVHPGPQFDELPFKPLFLLDNEFAGEVANKTMHGVMHLGWVRDEDAGGYRGQMAVLVKPNGLFGNAYMAAIKPFRHLLVYPVILRDIGREWREAGGGPTPASA